MKTTPELLKQAILCLDDLLSYVKDGHITNEDAIHRASMELEQIKKEARDA